MISLDSIKELAKRHQTAELNIAREYCQHVFLAAFYQTDGSERLLFKGGTALRIVYDSPRFSEDLDFSGFGATTHIIENVVTETVTTVTRTGIVLDIEEAKETTGGYLAIMRLRLHDFDIPLHIEISLRKRNGITSQTHLITSDLLPPYTILTLPELVMVSEKIEALLTRSKPRDYYDLYFILRKNLTLPKDFTARIPSIQKKLDDIQDLREIKQFLPASHIMVLKDFKTVLSQELKRRFPAAK